MKSIKPDSPLIGLGKKFKEVESKYNVNALFLYSLAIHESYYGTSALAKDKNNLFGLKQQTIVHMVTEKHSIQKKIVLNMQQNYT